MATTTKWAFDPAHSELTFKVKHLMIANVKGAFQKFDAAIEGGGDDDFAGAKVSATVETASIHTNNEARDGHLRSADFFDAENHPTIVFEGHSLARTAGGDFKLSGDLTMRGVKRAIELDVEFGGKNRDPWGNEKAAFSFSGKLNRSDFGLTWNAALEAGGVAVSDEVRIAGEAQFVKQAA